MASTRPLQAPSGKVTLQRGELCEHLRAIADALIAVECSGFSRGGDVYDDLKNAIDYLAEKGAIDVSLGD